MLKPRDGLVLVHPVPRRDKTAGGIVLPETIRPKIKEALVIAAGPGRWLESGQRATPDIVEGDRVLYMNDKCLEVEVGGKEYLLLNEHDILARLPAEIVRRA